MNEFKIHGNYSIFDARTDTEIPEDKFYLVCSFGIKMGTLILSLKEKPEEIASTELANTTVSVQVQNDIINEASQLNTVAVANQESTRNYYLNFKCTKSFT